MTEFAGGSMSGQVTPSEGDYMTGDRGAETEGAAPTAAFVRDLLSSDGARRPGDERLTGLGDALRTLDKDLQVDVAAALYCAAEERLTAAHEAETRAKYLAPDEFRRRNLRRAEYMARLWREACHVR